MRRSFLLDCLILSASLSFSQRTSISVDVSHPNHSVSPNLFGIFLEDINLAADGGLYPELIRNRSFENNDPTEFWSFEGAKTSICTGDLNKRTNPDTPLNPNNRQYLSVDADGHFSLSNSGYYGVNVVKGEKYDFTVAMRQSDSDSYKGSLSVEIVNSDGKTIAHAPLTDATIAWEYAKATLIPSESDTNAKVIVKGNGRGVVLFDMISLIPEKKWGRSGVREDLGKALNEMHPRFFRFPGGCWVEGEELSQRYQWKRTIGPVDNRIPLWNLWGYTATHGIGYHEYLQLAEDLGAEPLFCINAGVSHKETISSDELDQWIQDAIDAIEYANGPLTSVWGAARARNGHPEPFNLKYIEIGNENFGPGYYKNFELIANAVLAHYPYMQVVANDWSGSHPTTPMPNLIDEHYYNTPEWFMLNSNKYDSRDRNAPHVFIGEYAVTSKCGNGNLRGAVGEAAFMTGLERNSDLVDMAAYAPLFCNVNHQRWPINLINYDNYRWYGLPSYYVQKMFAENQGTQNLPVEVNGGPSVEMPVTKGGIGLGTWKNSAEFKELKVTALNGKVLYSNSFKENVDTWEKTGEGEWSVENGILRQSSLATGVTAFTGESNWDNYVVTLKARKLSGENGFQIYFHHQKNANNRLRWDVGGYNNSSNEMNTIFGSKSMPYSLEEGRWYDVRLEVSPTIVKGYLDGKLVQEFSANDFNTKAICASAVKDERTGDVIVKVVNTSEKATQTSVILKGLNAASKTAQAIVLTSKSGNDENTLDNPTNVSPRNETVRLNGNKINRSFPGNSVTVIRIKTR